MNKEKVRLRALSFLRNIDYTTDEGKVNYEKALDTFDKWAEKFEEIMSQFDKAIDKIDGKKSKSVLDNPLG